MKNVLRLIPLLFVLTAAFAGCAPSSDSRPADGKSPSSVDERNVVLGQQEILLTLANDPNGPAELKINQIEIRQLVIPDSVQKQFTFPAGFEGSVRFSWLESSGSYKESGLGQRLACNDGPLKRLDFHIQSVDGTSTQHGNGQKARVRAGDVLTVTVDSRGTDCTTIWTSFTAVVEKPARK